MLALSDEPQRLVEMVLDKILHLLKADYGWVQLVGSDDRNLLLVASRGSAPEMTGMVGLTDSQRVLGERVLAGLKVVIPDLSRDGRYGLSSFGLAGLRSLAAVPIRTYHTQGVIGVASRAKKRFDNEAAELLMTVAGLIGATINVAELGRIALDRERQRVADRLLKAETAIIENASQSTLAVVSESPTVKESVSGDLPGAGITKAKLTESKANDDQAFGDHSRSMSAFRRAHEKR